MHQIEDAKQPAIRAAPRELTVEELLRAGGGGGTLIPVRIKHNA